MMISLCLSALTTCAVASDGSSALLRGKDQSGSDFSLEVPMEHLGALAMTLPQLLTSAIKARYQDASLRYVFPLGEFQVEGADGTNQAILSLRTPDGFEVSFAVEPSTLKRLGHTCVDPPETVPDKTHH